ncbi:MAG: ligand-binding sensor domain-containing protein [Limisphaerales bacterium]
MKPRKLLVFISVFASVTLLFATVGLSEEELSIDDIPFPVIEHFENYGMKDGIPAHKVHAVYKATDGKIWLGTWDGLVLMEAPGKFKRYGPEDGLSHKLVLTIAEDKKTGDLWIGTMRGLNHFSGGKITTFTQLNSGLPNNVVYGVDVQDGIVWVSTAAGAGVYNPKTKEWKIYDHNNTVMHEPWCYSIKCADELVYIGVWGGGIIEHNPKAGSFKEYRDPDGDFHYDLVPDDGPVNDITSWLTWNEGILWQCTYFGFSRYDGKSWKTWVEGKTPLPSNFTQFVWPVNKYCWIGSDVGASTTDGEYWVNYLIGEKGEGIIEIHRPGRAVVKKTMSTRLVNCFVLGIWADENEAWFATSDGLSKGVFVKKSKQPGIAKIRQ